MPRTPLVAGNWKMNGRLVAGRELAVRIAAAAPAGCRVVICPPFPYLVPLAEALAGSPVALGAQDLSGREDGAFTGEVSAPMLADAGCRYVIVGHSERRSLHAETDVQVAEKFLRARGAGLTAILCVGESLEEREAGRTADVVLRQLDVVVNAAGVAAFANAVIAYEPVWAIGTGMTATPAQAQEVHALLRSHLALRSAELAEDLPILYGGSVKADNAAALFSGVDVDGGLIGGASLDADSFLAICQAAAT